MKAFAMAAGVLLMGTSAFAYDAGKGMDPAIAAQPKKAEAVNQSQQMKKAVLDVLPDRASVPKLQPSSDLNSDEPVARPASAVTWDEPSDSAQLASDTPGSVDTAEGDPNLDLTVKPDEAPRADATSDVSQYQGVGGPDEATEIASADVAPRAAAANYPACQPGPGDDRCIQLYEPGVREELAAWTQPTGGFAGQPVQTAMGGPYEPVGDDSADAGASGEVMAAADAEATVEPTLAYAGDGINGGPLDDEDIATA